MEEQFGKCSYYLMQQSLTWLSLPFAGQLVLLRIPKRVHYGTDTVYLCFVFLRLYGQAFRTFFDQIRLSDIYRKMLIYLTFRAPYVWVHSLCVI